MDSLLKIRPPLTRARQQQQRRRKFSAIAQRKRKCDFCPSTEAVYRCAQCDLPFCSSECFSAERHRLCSEAFYKKCVLEHLKHTKTDKEEQARFLQLLKRNSTATNEDILDYLDLINGKDNAESDDLESINLDSLLLTSSPQLRQFVEKLGARLGGDSSSGVSVEALDGAWLQLLDDADREEFIRLVNGHERLFSGLITQWRPWWRRQAWHRTVSVESADAAEDEDEEEEDEEEEEGSSYPCLYTQFERISKLTSKRPSPSIGLAIISTGEGEEDEEDELGRWTVDIALELFRLCPLLDSANKSSSDFVLENASQALELSLSCFLSSSSSSTSENDTTTTTTTTSLQQKLSAVELLEDLKTVFDFTSPGRLLTIRDSTSSSSSSSAAAKVLHAPKAILLVLSDLIVILSRVQRAVQKNFAKKNSKEEKSLAKRIELARRKLLFYLSWSVEFGEEEIIGQAGVLPAIEAEIVRLNQENLLFERTCEEVYEEEEEVRKTEKPSSSSSSKRVHFAPTTPTTTPLIEEIG
ncbi:Zinc finger HIT domain-containing protein 2 [Tyrophagus putrescentiae]|nr:Zinc finger HIT domain-containing protein 2 [Tyrophagus putrescentiae]